MSKLYKRVTINLFQSTYIHNSATSTLIAPRHRQYTVRVTERWLAVACLRRGLISFIQSSLTHISQHYKYLPEELIIRNC